MPGVDRPFTSITIVGPGGFKKTEIVWQQHGVAREEVIGAFATAAIEEFASALEHVNGSSGGDDLLSKL